MRFIHLMVTIRVKNNYDALHLIDYIHDSMYLFTIHFTCFDLRQLDQSYFTHSHVFKQCQTIWYLTFPRDADIQIENITLLRL